MGSSRLVRWGAMGLILGGVTWVILGLSAVFGYLQATPGRDDVVLFVVALLFTAAGLVGLHALQKGSYGLLGQVGFYLALVAVAARISGFVLYGVATLQARVLPRWYGVALIVSMPVSLLLVMYYGTVLFGLILIVLGYVLWLRRGAATGQPSRVR